MNWALDKDEKIMCDNLAESLVDLVQGFDEKGLHINIQWEVILHMIFRQIYDLNANKKHADQFITHVKNIAHKASKEKRQNFCSCEIK